MLFREIIAVCSQIHTKHINTLCGQNVESLNVKPGGTYNNHCESEVLKYTVWILPADVGEGWYYDKGYQQMPLSFVMFLYLYVSTLHVSGLYQPIIRGIPSRCLFVATWFM